MLIVVHVLVKLQWSHDLSAMDTYRSGSVIALRAQASMEP